MSDADVTEPPRRRSSDERIDHIERKLQGFQLDMGEKMLVVERKLDENTAATKASAETVSDVKNILTTFKTIGTFAKWAGYIVAAVASAIAAVKGMRG